MVELNKKQQQIVDVLTEKDALEPCPRCKKSDFSVQNYYCPLLTHEEPLDIQVTGKVAKVIPTAIVVCGNCGYIMLHNLMPLGLLPKEKNGQNTNDLTTEKQEN